MQDAKMTALPVYSLLVCFIIFSSVLFGEISGQLRNPDKNPAPDHSFSHMNGNNMPTTRPFSTGRGVLSGVPIPTAFPAETTTTTTTIAINRLPRVTVIDTGRGSKQLVIPGPSGQNIPLQSGAAGSAFGGSLGTQYNAGGFPGGPNSPTSQAKPASYGGIGKNQITGAQQSRYTSGKAQTRPRIQYGVKSNSAYMAGPGLNQPYQNGAPSIPQSVPYTNNYGGGGISLIRDRNPLQPPYNQYQSNNQANNFPQNAYGSGPSAGYQSNNQANVFNQNAYGNGPSAGYMPTGFTATPTYPSVMQQSNGGYSNGYQSGGGSFLPPNGLNQQVPSAYTQMGQSNNGPILQRPYDGGNQIRAPLTSNYNVNQAATAQQSYGASFPLSTGPGGQAQLNWNTGPGHNGYNQQQVAPTAGSYNVGNTVNYGGGGGNGVRQVTGHVNFGAGGNYGSQGSPGYAYGSQPSYSAVNQAQNSVGYSGGTGNGHSGAPYTGQGSQTPYNPPPQQQPVFYGAPPNPVINQQNGQNQVQQPSQLPGPPPIQNNNFGQSFGGYGTNSNQFMGDQLDGQRQPGTANKQFVQTAQQDGTGLPLLSAQSNLNNNLIQSFNQPGDSTMSSPNNNNNVQSFNQPGDFGQAFSGSRPQFGDDQSSLNRGQNTNQIPDQLAPSHTSNEIRQSFNSGQPMQNQPGPSSQGGNFAQSFPESNSGQNFRQLEEPLSEQGVTQTLDEFFSQAGIPSMTGMLGPVPGSVQPTQNNFPQHQDISATGSGGQFNQFPDKQLVNQGQAVAMQVPNQNGPVVQAPPNSAQQQNSFGQTGQLNGPLMNQGQLSSPPDPAQGNFGQNTMQGQPGIQQGPFGQNTAPTSNTQQQSLSPPQHTSDTHQQIQNTQQQSLSPPQQTSNTHQQIQSTQHQPLNSPQQTSNTHQQIQNIQQQAIPIPPALPTGTGLIPIPLLPVTIAPPVPSVQQPEATLSLIVTTTPFSGFGGLNALAASIQQQLGVTSRTGTLANDVATTMTSSSGFAVIAPAQGQGGTPPPQQHIVNTGQEIPPGTGQVAAQSSQLSTFNGQSGGVPDNSQSNSGQNGNVFSSGGPLANGNQSGASNSVYNSIPIQQ